MVLASSCRRRILKALWKLGRANVMELVRKVNSTYSQVNPNLQILEKEGIIVDERFGRMRIIRLNKENTNTLLLLKALRTLNTQMATNRKRPEEKKQHATDNQKQSSKVPNLKRNANLPRFLCQD
jgi:DNA-binding transcriptional ArsR family regulator